VVYDVNSHGSRGYTMAVACSRFTWKDTSIFFSYLALSFFCCSSLCSVSSPFLLGSQCSASFHALCFALGASFAFMVSFVDLLWLIKKKKKKKDKNETQPQTSPPLLMQEYLVATNSGFFNERVPIYCSIFAGH
jgi:hypothetical protein